MKVSDLFASSDRSRSRVIMATRPVYQSDAGDVPFSDCLARIALGTGAKQKVERLIAHCSSGHKIPPDPVFFVGLRGRAEAKRGAAVPAVLVGERTLAVEPTDSLAS